MKEYHKINSIFKRDERTKKFITGQWSTPEIGFLSGTVWNWTEKIDGTNVRIHWDGRNRRFGGRTDRASLPTHLLARLEDIFTVEKLQATFGSTDVTLYGEGFGERIQDGTPYGAVDFILFDVLIGSFYLEQSALVEICGKLCTRLVPVVAMGTLSHAIEFVRHGFTSWVAKSPAFKAEGIIATPVVQLFNRKGERIITKIKTRDFE